MFKHVSEELAASICRVEAIENFGLLGLWK